MDLTLLNYFYTVAREGSFMAAAEKLDYAQSNLSMRIKQLEEIAGTELLIRGRNGVTLTDSIHMRINCWLSLRKQNLQLREKDTALAGSRSQRWNPLL